MRRVEAARLISHFGDFAGAGSDLPAQSPIQEECYFERCASP